MVLDATRRGFLLGSIATAAVVLNAPLLAGGAASASQADLERYFGYGIKASGGPGDMATGLWMERELARAGFATARHAIEVPWFAGARTELVCGNARAEVIPQAVVMPTGADGVTGGLVLVHSGEPLPADLAGAIALIVLPHARWSSVLSPAVRTTVEAVDQAGAVAAVLVTTGPTGEAIALNAPPGDPLFGIPVSVIAPRDVAPFIAASSTGATATLYLTGAGGKRPAFNLIGKIDRGKGKWLVVSTPRSGWFGCVGERGPGVAVWLALARWAPAACPDYDLAFLSASGHEYEYHGARQLLEEHPIPAERTRFWFHLGANVAARDWQEAGSRLLPLPSADPQRYLLTTDALVPAARWAFAGLPGVEMAYPVGSDAQGELGDIAAAGYPRFGGIFGAHRYHHAQGDDLRCVSAPLVDAVIDASKAFLQTI